MKLRQSRPPLDSEAAHYVAYASKVHHDEAQQTKRDAKEKGRIARMRAGSETKAHLATAKEAEKRAKAQYEQAKSLTDSEQAIGFLAQVAKKAERLKHPDRELLTVIAKSDASDIAAMRQQDDRDFYFRRAEDSPYPPALTGLSIVSLTLDIAQKIADPSFKSQERRLNLGIQERTSRYNPLVASGLAGSEARLTQEDQLATPSTRGLQSLYSLYGEDGHEPVEIPGFSRMLGKRTVDKLPLNSFGVDLILEIEAYGPRERTETGGASAEYVHPSANAKVV